MTDWTDFSYCDALLQLMRSQHATLPDGRVVQAGSASTANNLRAIRTVLLELEFRNALETGCAYGASALAFCATMSQKHGVEYSHTAIDPFQDSVWKNVGLRHVRDAGFADQFTLIASDSALALPKLCESGANFDCIYVDGSHLFEDVFIDMLYCSRLLCDGGVILLDDCRDPHVRKVIRFIDSNYQSILTRYRVQSDGKLPMKKRIGRALGISQMVAYQKTGQPPRPWDAIFKAF